MTTELINDGKPTTIWNGIPHGYLLRRCEDATEEEAMAMSAAAALMGHGECTFPDWQAALTALRAVETRLCEKWEAENGAPLKNRHGFPLGGQHPGLSPHLYAEALANKARGK